MSRPCALSLAKVFLVGFNLLFLLLGLGLLALGLWLRFEESLPFIEILQGTPAGPLVHVAAYVLIGIGSFITLFAFLGCCGACTESICFLCLYTVVLLILMISQVVAAIVIAVLHNKMVVKLGVIMQHGVHYEYNKTAYSSSNANYTADPVSMAWNHLQVNLECCGATGLVDHKFSSWFNHTRDDEGDMVPISCCVQEEKSVKAPRPVDEGQCQIDAFEIGFAPRASDSVYTKGCHAALVEWVKTNMWIVIGVVIGLFVLQILGVFCACFLMVRLRKEQAKYPWYIED